MKKTMLIPKSGELFEATIKYLNIMNNDMDYIEIQDQIFLKVRPKDVPVWMMEFDITSGITGKDIYLENEYKYPNLKIEKELNFGYAKLCLLSKSMEYPDKINKLATSFPNIAKRKFPNAQIIELAGSVEMSANPELCKYMNTVDAVIDIVQSGQSYKENGLYLNEVIIETRAVLLRYI